MRTIYVSQDDKDNKMIQIRKNVFETNSSSTHSIAIPRKIDRKDIPKSLSFNFGEFGWEHTEVDPCDYLYTAIYNCDQSMITERLRKLSDCLERHDISYTFSKPKPAWYDTSELSYGSIDHAYGLESCGFFSILEDDDLLLRYLTDGRVYTGSDNDGDELADCYCAYPTITDYDKDGYWMEVPNPNHDEEKYEYFFKGN